MARRGLNDFILITGSINRAKSDANALVSAVEKIQELKQEIIDDQERKDAVIEFIDLLEDYSIQDFQTDFSRLVEIKDFIEGT